ncbi:hypothetical protein [Cupriavidus sp. USMAA2-4]|nr:hypothetical protein [Cupriavidus sp. USMAA2-4]
MNFDMVSPGDEVGDAMPRGQKVALWGVVDRVGTRYLMVGRHAGIDDTDR